jgi:LysM repeat protein
LIANRSFKPIAILVSAVLIATGFVAVAAAPKAQAANAAQFDPGNIISDSVFYDFGTMTAVEIQRFLNSKLPTCNDNDGGPKCIRDFVTDTPAMTGESGRCESLPAMQNQTAAQIIYTVANACKINPRVLIVTLQKEQGLIQGANPTKRMYDFAMGMNCPDTADCARSSAGFFYQMYKGAGQLQWYGDPRGSFTYLRVGTNITRRHQAANVEASRGVDCGSKTFMLKSQATAALYYYTPYVPNEAAMRNLYGTGDVCSAYGNRNFWRFYTDWFGNTIGGGFLLKSSDSGTYFIIDNTKYLIDDPDTVAALKPLGPLGTISQAYLDSFTDAGAMNRVVKSRAGTHFFVDGGQKYPFTNCNQAAQFGLDCATAVTLTSSQLSALVTGNNMTEYIQGENGQTFFIQDGLKRQILDNESLIDSRIGVPALSTVKVSAFKKLPWGKPIIRKGVSFVNQSTGGLTIFDGNLAYEVDAATAADVDFSIWFPKSTGTMLTEGLTAVASNIPLKTIVNGPDGTQYLITKEGKRKAPADQKLVKDAPVISLELLSAIPDSPAPLATGFLARTSATGPIHLIEDGLKRPLLSANEAARIGASLPSAKVETISKSALAQITTGSAVVAPGSFVRLGRVNYLIDGFDRALIVANSNQAALLGLKSPRTLTTAQMKGYNKTSRLTGIKFVCDAKPFVAISGKLYPVGEVDASHYPGRGLALDAGTCANLPKSNTSLGRFVRDANKKYYLVEAQTKRLIKNVAAYQKLKGASTGSVLVGPFFLSQIKTGTAAGSTISTEIFEPGVFVPGSNTPSPSPSPSVSASPSPSPTASRAPSPTPSPTVSRSPSPSPTVSRAPSPSPSVSAKPQTYTVVSGDTWSRIVSRLSVWGVTDAALTAANPSVTNKNLIRLGQVLTVP